MIPPADVGAWAVEEETMEDRIAEKLAPQLGRSCCLLHTLLTGTDPTLLYPVNHV